MKHKYMIILLIAIIYFFPFDLNLLLNKVIGMKTHIILYIIFLIIMLRLIPGKILKDKWRYFIKNGNGK